MRLPLFVASFILVSCAPSNEEKSLRDFQQIHSNAIVIDSHSDFLDRSAIDGSHINEDPLGAQTSLSKFKQGGIDAQFFSVFVPPAYENFGFAKRTDALIDRLQAEIASHPDEIVLALSSGDIHKLANSGKVAALIGIEGGHSIENEMRKLDHYYDRGVRYMTLTWANSLEWAGSSGDEGSHRGLSDFGKKVVAKMNDLGMMVDISHVSDATFWDVIATSRSPVIASHSSLRSIAESPRNMSDDMIKAVGKNGGVVQINFYSQFVKREFLEEFDALKKKAESKFKALKKKYKDDPINLDKELWSLEKKIELNVTPPTVNDLVKHIDKAVTLAGIDHVGLGSDFDGMGAPPKGIEHIGKMPNITKELARRGYQQEEIEKILGGNLLRVLKENERLAQK